MHPVRLIAIALISCALCLVAAPLAASPQAAILGEWWTEGKEGRIRFVRAEDGTYQGILVWGSNPGKDVNNPDPKRRNLSVLGSVLIWHLRYDDGAYVDGYVYNPRDGDTYRMDAELTGPNALKIRGYLGIRLLGQSQTWVRAE